MPDARLTAVAADDDRLLPFQIERPGLRGRLARLGPAADAILARHAYPPAVARLLGETLALAALLAGALKYDGVFTLQAKGDGPVRLMVADVASDGALRGYAQLDPERAHGLTGPDASIQRLLGAGYLAFTVDQGAHTERYQGIVALEGHDLAECAHHYFRQSEQLEAGIRLACAQGADGRWRAGGVMLQRLPPPGEGAEPDPDAPPTLLGAAAVASEGADEDWRRSLALLGSLKASELTDPALPAEDVLFRLFHEDGVRVYPAHRLAERCRCSAARVGRVLVGLPEDDRAHLLAEGPIVVTCEFCGAEYRYDAAGLAQLAAGLGDAE